MNLLKKLKDCFISESPYCEYPFGLKPITSYSKMPKCKPPKRETNMINENPIFEKIENSRNSFCVWDNPNGLDFYCECDDDTYNGSVTSVVLNKEQSLKLAQSIINYYK